MSKPSKHHLLVAAATLLVLSTPAFAGAPMASVSIRVRSAVPLNAPIRFQITGNCMARITPAIRNRLSLHATTRRIPGRWVRERKVALDRGLRFKFVPARPLPAGRYLIRLRGQIRGRFSSRRAWSVRVLPRKVLTAPTFAGLKGADCRKMTRGYFEGCSRWQGISLDTGQRTGRFALYFRKWKTPYTHTQRWEASGLKFNGPILQQMSKGRYLVTLLAINPADKQGGKVCEVLLTFPRDNGCKGFRFGRTLKHGKIGGWVLTSRIRKARCAIPLRNVRKGTGRAFRSRWDRTRFILP